MVWVVVEVEFVYYDLFDFCIGVLVEGEVCEDFGCVVDDGGVGVDGGVVCDYVYVFGIEYVDEGEEFFVYEGFDGCGVVVVYVGVDCGEVGVDCDE